ncbi:99_t:CDS:2 [Diversispora eburnea]|uniref:99_t:CDS:1 n=1 Tax=Diversispora eburnea TaxID=1213867 RepID=A0A9N8VMW5_9GLOM|nr:99_t:CDS:2 [Diversispora eburnea]
MALVSLPDSNIEFNEIWRYCDICDSVTGESEIRDIGVVDEVEERVTSLRV